MTIKNQRPTEIEAHIKYVCPNKKCRNEHWLSYNETRTKNFKVVCDCSTVFSPKPIKKLSIIYHKKSIDTSKEKPKVDTTVIIEHKIPQDILDKSSKIMQAFGFRKQEADNMLSEFYKTNPIDDYKQLVQNTLRNKE